MTTKLKHIISVASIRNRVGSACELLSKIELPSPGHDENLDSEIWDWVPVVDALATVALLREAQSELRVAEDRIMRKIIETHVDNDA